VLNIENTQSRKRFLQDGGTFFRSARLATQKEKTEIMPGRETAQTPQPIGVGDSGGQVLAQNPGSKNNSLAIAEVDRSLIKEIVQPGILISQVGEICIYVRDYGVTGLADYLQNGFIQACLVEWHDL
jgi:hypothetical protein